MRKPNIKDFLDTNGDMIDNTLYAEALENYINLWRLGRYYL